MGVEGAVDHIHLLLAGQLDEVDRVAGHPDGKLRILLRMIHGVQQHLPVEDVDIDVMTALAEITVQQAHQVVRALRLLPARSAAGTMEKV